MIFIFLNFFPSLRSSAAALFFQLWALTFAFVVCSGVTWAKAPAGSPLDPAHTIFVLDEAVLQSLTGKETVHLPHVLAAGQYPVHGGRVRYQLQLYLKHPPAHPLGVYISKHSLAGQLVVNGQFVATCAMGSLQNLRCLHRPWLVSVPAALWRPGLNEIEIEVTADDRQTNGLSALQVGPLHKLEESPYPQQYFFRVQLPQGLSWVTAILGLLALMVAFYLPGRSMYLWVGLASLAHALSNLNFLGTFAWPTVELFSWFAFASRMFSVPLLLLACIAFYGKDKPWHKAVTLAYALLGPVLVWVVDDKRWVTTVFYLPVLLIALVGIMAMARWTWESGKGSHALMLTATLAMLLAGFSDWQRLRGASAFEGVYLLVYASAGFLAIMGSVVMAELAAGLLRSRELTITLEEKVTEREHRLAEAYEQRLQWERAAAVTQERERLLSDMHDSLGAGLSTAQLLLRQGQLSVNDAAYLVQECMDDLRLVFDVSAHLDEDLVSLVADVRFRLEARFSAVGIQTSWKINADDMPAMGPSRSLQFMRMLQETMTNAMRHADARHLEVSLQWMESKRVLCLQVQDDGKGLTAAQSSGRGLANMARRASALGGELEVRASHPGTLVEFRLQL